MLAGYLIEQAITIAIERKKKYVWLGVWEKNGFDEDMVRPLQMKE